MLLRMLLCRAVTLWQAAGRKDSLYCERLHGNVKCSWLALSCSSYMSVTALLTVAVLQYSEPNMIAPAK